MKFTVTIVTLLSISSTWAVLAKRVEDPKDKREAPSGYPSSSSSGHSSSSYQPQLGHGDASSISVGAGYSIGGAKPAYSFGGHEASSGLQLSAEGLQQPSHGAYQLAPITLSPQQGIIGTDLSQIMSQLTHSLNTGAITLQPSNTVAEFHEGGQGGQELAYPQLNYAPKLQQYALGGQISSEPSYSAGTKGLSSYSTGPVLFNPNQGQEQSHQAFLTYAPSAGHSGGESAALSYNGAGHSFGGLSLGGSGHSLGGAALSLGGNGHSLSGLAGHSIAGPGASFEGLSGAGYSLGGAGHSLGGAGPSFGGSGHNIGSQAYSFNSLGASEHSLGGPSFSLSGKGHSFGGSGAHYKILSAGHGPSTKTAFKPSTFLGASIPSDSGSSSSHGIPSFGAGHSSLGGSSSHGGPSFHSFSSGGSHGALSHIGGHGPSFGSLSSFGGGASKYGSPLYTKAQGSLDSAAAYSSSGALSSPPSTTYGFPTASYPGSVHSASSGSPHYHMSSSKFPSSFGEGSSSYRAPATSHSSFSSHSSGPKFSFRYSSPKDSHGAYSETSYNTIKYSEELKPHTH